MDYNSGTGLYRLPKAPELIKIANNVAVDVFYDTSSDNAPKWVDVSTLNYDYGGQWFFDVSNNKNMLVTSTQISGDCINKVYKYINIVFRSTDVPGVDINNDYIITGNERMEL